MRPPALGHSRPTSRRIKAVAIPPPTPGESTIRKRHRCVDAPTGAHVASDRPQTAPYGSWKSPITSSRFAEQSIGLAEPLIDGDGIYWLEQRPTENRYVIVRRPGSGGAEDVLPPPYSARTRVHEYGGGAWTVSDGVVYFSNDRSE